MIANAGEFLKTDDYGLSLLSTLLKLLPLSEQSLLFLFSLFDYHLLDRFEQIIGLISITPPFLIDTRHPLVISLLRLYTQTILVL